MNTFSKNRPLRLDQATYDQLRRQVLDRDGWRCQHCGRREQLEVHHLQYRSQSGADSEDNLITLCWGCHRALHATIDSAHGRITAPFWPARKGG